MNHFYRPRVASRASKYTDLPVFLRISDYKYGRNFENTESFGQLGKHYNMCSLLLNMEITYKIRKNGVCYTEIQAAGLEALLLTKKRA